VKASLRKYPARFLSDKSTATGDDDQFVGLQFPIPFNKSLLLYVKRAVFSESVSELP